jgi:hypothetical protein
MRTQAKHDFRQPALNEEDVTARLALGELHLENIRIQRIHLNALQNEGNLKS